MPIGPKEPKSTGLSIEEEAITVAFRRHALLPLDDDLQALQAATPRPTLSSLHRSLQRHGISRLSEHSSRCAAIMSIAGKIGGTAQTLNERAKKAKVDSGRNHRRPKPGLCAGRRAVDHPS